MPQEPTHDDTLTLDPTTRLEVKRLSILFILSALTLLLIIVYAGARALLVHALETAVVPDIAWVMWAASMLCGFVATWVYGVYVTARARRWFWVALCALPPSAVPCALAYAWIRRGELEAEIRSRPGAAPR